jgi:hypothetical protein
MPLRGVCCVPDSVNVEAVEKPSIYQSFDFHPYKNQQLGN